MITIKGKTYNSRDFFPSDSSKSDDYIKNDKQVASDNIEVKPLSISSIIFYKAKNDDKAEAIKFIKDIIANRETITVVDLDNNIEYGDLYISNFNITKYYKDGFVANIEFGYIPKTQTAMGGANQYEGYSIRNEKNIQRPLKINNIPTADLPTKTVGTLTNLGIDTSKSNVLLKSLDFDIKSLFENNVTERIQTTIGDFTGIFEIGQDGTLDIFDRFGNYLSMGNQLFSNVELMANSIPGVDVSLKVIPITEKAASDIFDISRLGQDFILNAAQVKSSFQSLGDL